MPVHFLACRGGAVPPVHALFRLTLVLALGALTVACGGVPTDSRPADSTLVTHGGRLAAMALRPGPDDRLAFSEIVTVNVDGTDPLTVSPPGHFVQWYDYHPATRRFVYSAFGSDSLYIIAERGGSVTRFPTGLGTPRQVSWSSDGSRIAFNGASPRRTNIYVVGQDGTNLHPITRFTDSLGFIRIAWRPRADSIAFSLGGALRLIPAGSIGNDDVIGPIMTFGWFEWSRDGATIAAEPFQGGQTVTLFDVATRSVRALRPVCDARCTIGPADRFQRPHWSPDGTRLLLERAGGLDIVRVADGAIIGRFPGAQFSSGAWSPDGTQLALVAAGPSLLGLGVASADNPTWSPVRTTSQFVNPIWLY